MYNKYYNIKYCTKDKEGHVKRIFFNSNNKRWFCLLPDTMEAFYIGRPGKILIVLFEDEDLFESKNDINIFDSIYNLDSIKDTIISTVEELCNSVIIPETICFRI